MPVSVVFSIEPLDRGAAGKVVVPVVGGMALTDRIDAFELATGMETTPSARYGGLSVSGRLGPASAYYFGRTGRMREPGKVALLGCSCGDMGCYPLFAHVEADIDVVRWVDFEQPYHRERDYSGFGPFVFDLAQYEAAIDALGGLWRTPT